MGFQSAPFFLLLAATIVLYFTVPVKFQNYVLLAVCWIFYSYTSFKNLLLLIALTLLVYGASHWLTHLRSKGARRCLLTISLLLLFSNLVFFKYYEPLRTSCQPLSALPSWGRLAAPLGVSFYTFMLAGFLIDVSRQKQKPERNFVRFSLFSSFFPIISSGPIERGRTLLPQFEAPHRFEYETFCCGASRMLWGFFKKFVLAEMISISVSRVFSNLSVYQGPFLLLAALMYSYQLYCDFSGYSDIAIGTARLLGFTVCENFARPFAARSFQELWRRWHISLTSWFRDYLYFPLGGSRKGTLRTYVNIMIVFLASGIWHGAALNFAIWGAMNGVFMVLSRAAQKRRRENPPKEGSKMRRTLSALVRIAAVYLMFTACIVFFRAQTTQDALYVYANLFTGWKQALLDPSGTIALLKTMNIGRVSLLVMAGGAALVEWGEWRAEKAHMETGEWVRMHKPAVRIALYYVLLLALAFFGALGTSNFIYFDF